MATLFKCFIIVLIVFSYSCKKENTPEQQASAAKVAINMIDLVCYPKDSISLTFQVIPVDSTLPYDYKWIHPDTLTGKGPFTIPVKTNVLLDLEIIDSKNIKTRFQYEIKKDTIDSLKYDYRNSVTGNYSCDVTNKWMGWESPGGWTTNYRYYQEEVKVGKSSHFSQLTVSVLQADMSYKFRDNSFNGYHASGRFKGDSIFIQTQPGLGPYWYTYKGKKLVDP